MEYTHPQNLGPALKVSISLGKHGIKETSIVLDDEPGLKWTFSGDLFLKECVHHFLLCYAEKKMMKLPSIEYPVTTLFTERVWRKVAEVPFGTTSNYSEIAAAIGHPLAYRAVGSACRKNILMLFVPCHRIVKSNNAVAGDTDEAIRHRLLNFEKN